MEYKQENVEYFNGVETVIDSPLHFKSKLYIGEDAYTSEKLKKSAFEVWDTVGVAATAAGFAQSSAVASTFFAPTGFWAIVGFGTAVTPIGWVIAASVVTGGAWIGITKHLKKSTNDKITVIPNFINTPIDILGLGLFDLLAPIAIKVAHSDGKIDDTERKVIHNYFVKEWGFSSQFICSGLAFIESNISSYSIEEQCKLLSDFQKSSPDCNQKEMSKEIITFIQTIIEADDVIDDGEIEALDKVKSIFGITDKWSIKKSYKQVSDMLRIEPII